MLSGFANNNMSQNRFMARTRKMSDNFANAIGSTTTNKDCKYVNQIVGYSPSGHPIVERKLVCSTPTAKFDGGFANAIGSTTTIKQDLRGCGSGANGGCPTCYRCSGGTCYPAYQVIIPNTSTPTEADFKKCVSLYGSTSKFDGGFANAVGKRSKRRLQFDGGFDYASGSIGAGTYKDDLLDFNYADGTAGGDCCVGKVCPRGSLCQTWYTQTTPTMRMKHCGCRFEDMRNK